MRHDGSSEEVLSAEQVFLLSPQSSALGPSSLFQGVATRHVGSSEVAKRQE
jgi:hypothetical protein